MLLLNLKTCDFVIYSDIVNNFVTIKVPFDADFAHAMVFKLKDNFFDKLLHNFCILNRCL